MKNETVEVKIEKIVSGGKGIGYFDGKVVFADRCIAGETVTINVINEKKNYIVGEVIAIKEPSPARIAPECKYFGACGGCDFWHVDYNAELACKKQWFIETVNKIGKIALKDVEISGSAPHTHYRNRAQFKIRNINGEILFGFYKKSSNYVINIDNCLICNQKINQQIEPTKSFINALPFNNKIPQVDFSVDDKDKTVIMIIHAIDNNFKAIRNEMATAFSKYFGNDVKPFLQIGRKNCIEPVFKNDANAALNYALSDKEGNFDYELRMSPGSFLQVNYSQNLRLIDTALQYMNLTKADSVLDLFCGGGNFSFPASSLGKDVTGIESYPPAIADAMNNKRMLGVENVNFICGDVESEIAKLIKAGKQYDAIIIDPPREGAISALKEIKAIAKGKIVYISCDIATFARDAAFLKSVGFKLEDICLVDMFPRTSHIETVAKFGL